MPRGAAVSAPRLADRTDVSGVDQTVHFSQIVIGNRMQNFKYMQTECIVYAFL